MSRLRTERLIRKRIRLDRTEQANLRLCAPKPDCQEQTMEAPVLPPRPGTGTDPFKQVPAEGGDPVTPTGVYVHGQAVQLPKWQGWAKAARKMLEQAGQHYPDCDKVREGVSPNNFR